MVICLKTMDQYTGVNLMNPYSKDLMRSVTPGIDPATGQPL